jgi:hypothetical protein
MLEVPAELFVAVQVCDATGAEQRTNARGPNKIK